MNSEADDKRARQAKYLAVGAADFRVEEAKFFVVKAAEGKGNARDFRFFLDAALDAIDAAMGIAEDVVGKDRVLKKVIKKRLEAFSEERETKIVIGNRISAHHRYKRAALRGFIEAGELVRDLSAHDHVEYAIIVRPGLHPKDQTITWTFVDGTDHCDALAFCSHVVTGLAAIIADIRARLGLQPDKGLKRLGMQVLKEGPVIHRPSREAGGGKGE